MKVSLIHITTKNIEISLVGVSVADHIDIKGLCINGSVPHCMQCSGELAPCAICSSTQGGRSCTTPRQKFGGILGGRCVGELA